ncbi:MAG TPA: hypothetical protein ENK43_03170 [Planctomycetes bacterium]|nr:hypothetical protein [Planctomycetota bacterium]
MQHDKPKNSRWRHEPHSRPGRVSSRLRWMPVFLAFLLATSFAAGQLPVRFDSAVLGLTGANHRVQRIGDQDGDGLPDLVILHVVANVTTQSIGELLFYSSRDGALVRTLTLIPPSSLVWGSTIQTNPYFPPNTNPPYVEISPVDDVNGDGFDDVAIMASKPDEGIVFTVSSVTGGILASTALLTPLRHITTLGDSTGDGYREVALSLSSVYPYLPGVIGPIYPTVYPQLRLLSGLNLATLVSVTEPLGDGLTDSTVSVMKSAGDVNGDGVEDFLVTRPGYVYHTPSIGPIITGLVTIRSGVNASLIRNILGFDPTLNPNGMMPSAFGSTAAGVGDVDGDGFGDIAVGAPGWHHGDVGIFSGATGFFLQEWIHPISVPPSAFGGTVEGCGDMNGDGTPDIAIGEGRWINPQGSLVGKVSIYSGADFSLLFEKEGPSGSVPFAAPGTGVGSGLLNFGDMNGDGFPELRTTVVGAAGSTSGDFLLLSFGGKRRFAENLGGLQTLDCDWSPATTGDPAAGTIMCTGGLPGTAGVLGVSAASANTTILNVPVLLDLGPQALISSTQFLFDGQGEFSAPALIRYPALGGVLVYLQSFSLAFPYASSNGLELLLVP